MTDTKHPTTDHQHDTASPAHAQAEPRIDWVAQDGTHRTAQWRTDSGAPSPKRVVLADDTMPADTAYRLACEGTALLWSGDFQNARQLVQALSRRLERTMERTEERKVKRNEKRYGKHIANNISPHSKQVSDTQTKKTNPQTQRDTFNAYRMAQSQRARILGMVLVPLNADYTIALRRAPDWRQACEQTYGQPSANNSGNIHLETSVVALRELLGIVGAYEWRKNGVPITQLKNSVYDHVHPHYGVFSPIRGEYLSLVASAALPASQPLSPNFLVFDIGTGTGVLAAIMAQRGAPRVIATDTDPRALACATENIARIGYAKQITVLKAHLFPPIEQYGKAHLIICNPPWLPAKPAKPLERAIYDPNSAMLRGFLNGLAAHLVAGGEGWLILSDIAEHLSLRSRDELLAWVHAAGLKVLGKQDIKPMHGKALDPSDALHTARSRELTSLWRLGAQD